MKFEDPKPDENTPVEYIKRTFGKKPVRKPRKSKDRSCTYELDLNTGKASGLTVIRFAD